MIDDDDLSFPEDPAEPEFKDSPFNPWRFAKTDKSRAIVDEAIRNIQFYEKYRGLRQRGRKKHDQQTFEMTIEAVLCDLMNHRLSRRPDAIYVTRSNDVLGRKNRYRPRVYGKTFPDVLDNLAAPELSWIVQDMGDGDWRPSAKRTTIRPGSRLVERMEHLEITLADLGYQSVAEPIVLKREKADFWDEGGVIDYRDTEDTIRFRRQMQEINEWLRVADLDYGTYRGDTRPALDTDERSLRRIFTQGSFASGGRLFGGFWQGMKKADRFERLVIDGEAIAELDYGQMGARQLYGRKGVTPTVDDLYAIPGFERCRSGVKVIFSAMVFHDKPLTRMPRWVGDKFPKGTKVTDVTDAIKRRHPEIVDLFFHGIGHEIQFQESEIMVDMLLKLKGMGIVALPIHDAVLVPASQAEPARQVMLDVFFDHVGFAGSVDILPVPEGSP